MSRRLTGFTPSGNLHLGNYFGAIRPIIAEQRTTDTVVFISDLHALTLDHDPTEVRERTLEFATPLLAAGLDRTRACSWCSPVPEHTELHFCWSPSPGTARPSHDPVQGEARRQHTSAPAADLSDPDGRRHPALRHRRVPVGDDQQHVELARDHTQAHTATATFTVPRVVNPPVAARGWTRRRQGEDEQVDLVRVGRAAAARCAGPAAARSRARSPTRA
jgi:tryptophanyl-tRNA synthetase